MCVLGGFWKQKFSVQEETLRSPLLLTGPGVWLQVFQGSEWGLSGSDRVGFPLGLLEMEFLSFSIPPPLRWKTCNDRIPSTT